MATYSTNEFRQGLKIMLDGEPCVVVESEFVKHFQQPRKVRRLT